MEYSQNRNGFWDVWDKGCWIGMAAQLSDGRFFFADRLEQVMGISVTLEGAVMAALYDTDEEEEEDEN